MDLLDQFIMGSANTPANILKIYQQLNLSMCSINCVEIPKTCTSYVFWNIFEHCLKYYNMTVLGIYKRHEESIVSLGEELWGSESYSKTDKESKPSDEKESIGSDNSNRKPFVWLHPPKNITLFPND